MIFYDDVEIRVLTFSDYLGVLADLSRGTIISTTKGLCTQDEAEAQGEGFLIRCRINVDSQCCYYFVTNDERRRILRAIKW